MIGAHIFKPAALLRDAYAYTLAGAFGTVLHYIVFIVLTTHTPPANAIDTALAATAGALAGAALNYLLSHRHVFRSQSPHRRTAPRFALVAAATLVLNGLIVGALSAAGAEPLPAQLAASAVTLASGFLVNRQWSFA
jgi:putative flippase GtrA